MKTIKRIIFFPFESITWVWRLLTVPFWAKGTPRERYFLVILFVLAFFAASVVYAPLWNKPVEEIASRIEYSGTKLSEWTGWSWPLSFVEVLSPKPMPSVFLDRRIDKFSLGLDLVGGAHLEYKVDTSELEAGDVGAKLASLRDAIERRVNLFGVNEPIVQVASSGGENRLIVELAGVTDLTEAIDLVGQTARLEFRTQSDEEPPEFELPDVGPDGSPFTEEQQQQFIQQLLTQQDSQFEPTELNGEYLKRASVVYDNSISSGAGNSGPQIQLEFNDEGAELFRELTGANVGKPIAIFLDETLLTAPTVQQEITGGTAVITGNYTIDEAKQQVALLNAGALPVDVELIAQRSVGATLGAESLVQMRKAAFATMILIILFMIFIYRLPGLVALVTLAIYVAFMLALYKLVPVTLTLAGIAGFILSIGMAVDANILIFARMREEKKRGRTPVAMVEEGFSRAWTAIRDANLSTLITTLVLYTVGTSFVQGFALALGVGVIVSMFTAYIVARFLLREVARHPKITKPWIF